MNPSVIDAQNYYSMQETMVMVIQEYNRGEMDRVTDHKKCYSFNYLYLCHFVYV